MSEIRKSIVSKMVEGKDIFTQLMDANVAEETVAELNEHYGRDTHVTASEAEFLEMQSDPSTMEIESLEPSEPVRKHKPRM